MFVDSKPYPTGTEQRNRRLGKLVFERFDRPEFPNQRFGQFFRDFLFPGRQSLEKKRVVPRLCCIIKDRTVGAFYNLIEGHIGVRRISNQAIEIVDISLQMFTIMVINGFLTHHRSKSIGGIRKFGHYMCHSRIFFS